MIFLVLGIVSLAIAMFMGAAWLMSLRREINDTVWTGRQVDDVHSGRKAGIRV